MARIWSLSRCQSGSVTARIIRAVSFRGIPLLFSIVPAHAVRSILYLVEKAPRPSEVVGQYHETGNDREPPGSRQRQHRDTCTEQEESRRRFGNLQRPHGVGVRTRCASRFSNRGRTNGWFFANLGQSSGPVVLSPGGTCGDRRLSGGTESALPGSRRFHRAIGRKPAGE